MAYTALERSDNARVRKFAPCANLTNLKEAIVSKKENITNSERTGKKDNVSDTVNFAPIERGLHRQSSFNWSERREHTRHWSEATMRGCANLTNLKGAIVSKKENITNSERTGKKDNVSDTVNFAPNGRNSVIRRWFLPFK